jgi:hypothetical protein
VGAALAGAPRLQSLTLFRCRNLQASTSQVVWGHPKLTRLDLTGCQVMALERVG